MTASSVERTITFCLNSFWKSFKEICPKTHRARHHLQHVLMSPSPSNLVVLYTKFLGSKRLKMLGSLCVAANSCAALHPLLEKYSTGCFLDRALITTKCPGIFTNFLRVFEWTLYNTTSISLPASASFKFFLLARESYFTTRHHLGTSVASIS